MAAGASTVSVVLATYNGQRYLAAQLRSIVQQTRPPDEVVVCDDASTDQSVAIAADFLTAARLPHRVLTTAENLGVTVNFARGIAAADGDIVVLADQDDIWYPEKLAVIEAAFAGRPRPLAVFTDADVVDSSGASLGSRLWARAGLGRRRLQAMVDGHVLPVLMHKNFVTGATLAFDAGLRELIQPLSDQGLHDHWIAVIAAAMDGLRPIPAAPMAYRVHGRNTVGLPGGSLSAQWRARSALGDVRAREIAFHEALLTRLRSLDGVPATAISTLEGKLRHVRFRSSLPSRRVLRCLSVGGRLATGDYARFSLGVRSALYDAISG
jgi:glycosyltransferase involved in cell wall biosynthesis